MDMKGRQMEIHVDRIDLPAMPRDGERRLREVVARELAGIAGEGRAGAHCPGPERARAAAPSHIAPDGSDAVAASIAGEVRAGLSRGSGR
jgi:hypothetical protein